MQVDYAPFTDRMIHKYEGGYGWNRRDPGGPTKYGVTCFDLAEHRGQRMDSMARWAPIVRDMSIHEAEEIYAEKYATAVRFNQVQKGVDCVLMDYAVNSGVGRIVPVLRAVLKTPGSRAFDQKLLDAVNAAPSKWLIDAVCDERMHFLRQIRTWGEFGVGWTRRVADLRAYSEALAAGITEPHSTAHDVPRVGKGRHTPRVTGTHVGTATAGGATAGAAMGVSPGVIFAFVAASTALGVAIVVYQHQQAARLNTTVVLPQGGTNAQPVAKSS